MKAIILAGGYAKRLWPLTKETPKPLLDIGGKEMITRIIEKIEKIEEIEEIAISTNEKFEGKFKKYVKSRKAKKPIKIVVEPTSNEGKKLGSIGGLNFLMDHLKIDDDVFIIGGDNIFEFDLRNFFDYHIDQNASVIALKKIKDKELIKTFGVCALDKNKVMVEFYEKPEKPKSDLASTACYIFTYNDFMLIKRYIDEGNSPDAMGSFISWLIKKADVYGYVFEEDWYDIGSFEQLDEARKKYS